MKEKIYRVRPGQFGGCVLQVLCCERPPVGMSQLIYADYPKKNPWWVDVKYEEAPIVLTARAPGDNMTTDVLIGNKEKKA